MTTETQREASLEFSKEIKPIEDAHDAVLVCLKSIRNSILFNVEDIKLNFRLRKEIEEIENLHYTELKLTTNTIRRRYI